MLYYGSRKSGKLVRVYWKEELEMFRIEPEFHSSIFQREGIACIDDLTRIADVAFPNHVEFVTFDWPRLAVYLRKRFGHRGKKILVGAQKLSGSLHRTADFLRSNGVPNVHRFFLPLESNRWLESALAVWRLRFKSQK